MEDVTQALELTPSDSMAGDTPVPTTDLTGRTLGEFHVLRRLGEGGMGQVYLAEQISLQRKVALKVLKKEMASDSTSLERFKAEALAVARVTHANIVQVYAIDEEAGVHYMALEYVEGRNLRDYLAKKGTLDAPLAISIMRQVAAALQRAAESGIIHRDIKPENILLTRKGEVKVADFGLSRSFGPEGKMLNLTQSGVTMGTPLYMSPEQVQGLSLDPRTDIYSFGVTSYHMLSGQPPFRSGTAFEVALQHIQAEPEPLTKVRPDLPNALCALVHKMMAKKPDDRYQSSRDLLRDLAKLRDNISGASQTLVPTSLAEIAEPSTTNPDLPHSQTPISAASAPAPLTPTQVSHWLRWAVPASLVAALLAGSALGLRNHKPSTKSDSASNTTIDLTQVEGLFSPNKREQTLKETAKLYKDPGKDNDKIHLGLEVNRELALLYLDQGRWDEADQLFQDLMRNSGAVEVYAQVGKLGHAIVLGLQSQSAQSNELFIKCLPKLPEKAPFKKLDLRDRLGNALMTWANPRIRQWIGEALEYNYKNDPATFPRTLEPWRKGPLVAGPPNGK